MSFPVFEANVQHTTVKKKLINLDGIHRMLCYNASDIAFMGISSFGSDFLNTSHHLLINFKTGTEWKLKKKRKS